MTENNEDFKVWAEKKWGGKKASTGGGIYFLGFIGAAIYYISTATDFWMGAFGILKAIVWPAFLVFSALSKLGG
jgi:hypothetical protein